MAYCKPEKKWDKGQSGNPKGRPPTKRIIKEIREQIGDDLEKYLKEIMGMDKEQLESLLKDGKQNALKLMIVSIALKGIKRGDPSRLEALLCRAVGKVKEQVEVKTDQTVTVNFGFPRPERKE